MNKGQVLQVGTPFEIYESPATEFVAQFIGETNIFPSKVTECSPMAQEEGKPQEYMVTLETPLLNNRYNAEQGTEDLVKVTDFEITKPGQKICYTVRPEKIRITLEPPVTNRQDINIFTGIVEEPIYSGFQSKFYVRLDNGTLVKVYKQHSTYLDDGPEIQWKDRVFVSWSANDGYIVEDIEA